ncbi:MAG: hypothetical protein M1835_002237 [Candelina submexicana]|nr:MAG: hypothetical protein M1835_002237 [Candelina submexicana]
MAPIELDHPNSNLQPLAIFAIHLTTIFILIAIIGRFIYRGNASLPPSQATRHRESRRWKHVQVFVVLAVLSCLVAFYFQTDCLMLSYKVWALERGEQLPTGLWGEHGIFGGREDAVELQLGRWAHDTFPMVELYDIVFEKSKRAWWSQQLLLGATAWSVFMSIEGRRRNIQYLWAYNILSHLVGQSFAQNLFYLAILVTPVSFQQYKEGSHPPQLHKRVGSSNSNKFSRGLQKAESVAKDAGQTTLFKVRKRFQDFFAPKPTSWVPHPGLYLVPLAVNYIAIFLTSFAANTASFITIIAIHDSFLFYPLVLDRIVPRNWGTTYSSSHDAHRAYTRVFKFISVASFVLYGKATLVAMLDNTPDSHYHRHSMLFTHLEEHRSKLERGSTALAKVLGAINDHPAVGRAGWDVLLCGISLVVWAAVRGLDVGGMLESSAIMSKARKEAIEEKAIQVVDGVKENASHVRDEVKGKATHAVESVKTTAGKAVSESKATAMNAVNAVKQRSKKIGNSIFEEPAPTTAVKKGRGRPKGTKNSPKPKSDPVHRTTRQSRNESEADLDGSESDDEDYQPNEVLDAEGEEEMGENTEAGALAWGLLAVGGLGVGSAAVFGAEVAGF